MSQTTDLPRARLQVIWNRLLAVIEEQGQTLFRATFSPIMRECGDISAEIFDTNGLMLAQAVTGTPGDIYMTNDPWLASGHLSDFLLLMPAFKNGRVSGYTSCASHLVDLGGLGLGSKGSDVFDEGLLITRCKLVDQGEINALLLDIVKANSREPIANERDIYALVACCEAGVSRLIELMDDYGLNDLNALSGYIIDTSHRGTLEAIAEVPQGVYINQMNADGYEMPRTLKATLTVTKDRLHLDFSGTSGRSAKGVNVPLNYATAYSVFAMRCTIGPDIPNNAGSLEPFVVTGPTNCILNAQRPVPVAMRHTLGQMTPDLVLGCLHQALPHMVPAEGSSCMYDLPMRHTADAVMR
jgi:N-methylhydantoinase B